ncbi:superfamily II DNA/RNA helicase [Clostridium moniliforme]|uniref:RNA helicase n=1 Tax=Clostridium moniliforme TaxID=39489 RepID=A0ABS4F139_9CLOT|nr:DEAD/DEAH box helicase [Clostridium moniliforme]MBP1889787.1 superfamily II DNA/RNA helicase [Clostridium moniliforme]
MSKKLNLNWVSDAIGEDYKKWKKGDVVKIQAQTGTGKTYFITGAKNFKGLIGMMNRFEKMIYICNRIELKRQIKLELLKKFNKEIIYKDDKKVDTDWLDKQCVIGNVVITSYHAISEGKLDNIYLDKNNNLEEFDYIICDECHFFLTDSSYNNKTYLAFEELITQVHLNSIKIFISATMDEVNNAINKNFNKRILPGKHKIFEYDTNRDYSYLNVKYFKNLEDDIFKLIKNDNSNYKWLIFVTSKKKGENLKNKLNNSNISTEFIYSNKKSKEKENILSTNSFISKVLITTKCLDNGVNIKDKKVKNLVVIAYDKVTFIQEIGRKRLNIEDAEEINLYIPCLDLRVCNTILKKYREKNEQLKLFDENINEFKRKYNHNPSYSKDLFYLTSNNEYKVNLSGYARFLTDNYFIKTLKKDLSEDKFAYIKRQLEWLGLEDTFDERNLIENVVDNKEKNTLDDYLKNILGKKLFEQEQQELSNLIVNELISIKINKDYRTKKLRPSTMENIIRNDLELNYAISETGKESKGVNRGKRYIIFKKIQ